LPQRHGLRREAKRHAAFERTKAFLNTFESGLFNEIYFSYCYGIGGHVGSGRSALKKQAGELAAPHEPRSRRREAPSEI